MEIVEQWVMSVALMGVAVDSLSMEEFLQAVDRMIAEGGFHQIATANADFLSKSLRDDELRDILWRCDYVLPDGMPLIWASRLLGTRLKERVSGADIIPHLTQRSAERGYRLFLLGANEESSVGTLEWITKEYPEACLVGRYCPPVNPLEAMDHEDILLRIQAAQPDILLVAFGNPKQEKWLDMHRDRLQVPVCIGVGGSFDLLSGRIPRAPRWMQVSGMEWFHRMVQEPRRLGMRYLVNALTLLRYLPIQVAISFLQRWPSSPGWVETETQGDIRILHINGSFTGDCVRAFEIELRKEQPEPVGIVIDLSEAKSLGADGIGALMRLAVRTDTLGFGLWLTGLRPSARWVLRATHLASFFRTAPDVADAMRAWNDCSMPMS